MKLFGFSITRNKVGAVMDQDFCDGCDGTVDTCECNTGVLYVPPEPVVVYPTVAPPVFERFLHDSADHLVKLIRMPMTLLGGYRLYIQVRRDLKSDPFFIDLGRARYIDRDVSESLVAFTLEEFTARSSLTVIGVVLVSPDNKAFTRSVKRWSGGEQCMVNGDTLKPWYTAAITECC